jgi:hypothetical protein
MPNRLFGDRLFSVTDMSRQAGKILDLALKAPVTVTRGDHHFALMRRELASSLFGVTASTEALTDVLMACQQRLAGDPLPQDDEYSWMAGLAQDDLVELIRAALESFRTSMSSATAWTAFDDTIRQWKDGALAAASPSRRGPVRRA